MKFIGLILAVLVMYYWRVGAPLQRDALFQAWQKTCNASLSLLPAGATWAFMVVLPALLVGIAVEAVGSWLWGLLSLALTVVVLVYSLGRGELHAQVEDYLASWQQGDWQGSWHHAQAFVSQEMLDDTADPVQLHEYACRAMVYQGFERLFAVVFWFMILGPAGALLYRLTRLQAQALPAGAEASPDLRFLYWLEWLPARVLAFTFALAGNFSTSVQAVESGWLDMTQGISAFLGAALAGALQWTPLQFPASGDEADIEAFIHQGQQDVRGLLTLLARCGMIWLALIALWQILTIW